MTTPKSEGPEAATPRPSEPTPHQKGSSVMTVHPDVVLRRHHLESALHHVRQTVRFTEGLAGGGAVTTTSYLAGLRRRRAATADLRQLHCGCRDPWTCRHYDAEPEITEQFINGYRDAAKHLLAAGLTPAPNVRVMRAMWARGGDDQRLAMRVAEAWEVA